MKIDPGIVRGLAYYTGTVFEVFDLKHNLRAVAGGGRYDNLVALLSDSEADLPACGFAMGDVVLTELLNRTPAALEAAQKWMASQVALDAYVIVADEARRKEALGIVQMLREANWRVDYPLTPTKMNKQFSAADSLKARFAIIVGQEWPKGVLKVRTHPGTRWRCPRNRCPPRWSSSRKPRHTTSSSPDGPIPMSCQRGHRKPPAALLLTCPATNLCAYFGGLYRNY